MCVNLSAVSLTSSPLSRMPHMWHTWVPDSGVSTAVWPPYPWLTREAAPRQLLRYKPHTRLAYIHILNTIYYCHLTGHSLICVSEALTNPWLMQHSTYPFIITFSFEGSDKYLRREKQLWFSKQLIVILKSEGGRRSDFWSIYRQFKRVWG